jgi:copper chaperone
MIELAVPDMSCAHCKAAVERALAAAAPGATVEVDLPARRVRVDAAAEPATLIAALAAAGYGASVSG